MSFELDGSARMSVEQLVHLAQPGQKITITAETIERVRVARSKLESFVNQGRVIYGVNTGMGGFVQMLVPIEKAPMLQENLLNAVATNVGEYLNEQTTRA